MHVSVSLLSGFMLKSSAVMSEVRVLLRVSKLLLSNVACLFEVDKTVASETVNSLGRSNLHCVQKSECPGVCKF